MNYELPLLQVSSTLTYFDLFNYPLTKPEIYELIHFDRSSNELIDEAISVLISENLCFQNGEFYTLINDPLIAKRRKDGNVLAEKKWPVAVKTASFINYFPFVKGVWISGSLSKNFMDVKSDIDFFIVTSKNRLWICRTLLVLYKKIFLFNSHKNFCLNYFIDEDNLKIQEQNLFTATELVTLKPLINSTLYYKFIESNSWTKNFLPNSRVSAMWRCRDKSPRIKRIFENVISIFPLNRLDSFFMNQTVTYWKKKFDRLPPAFINSTIVSDKHQSRHHPQGYKSKVLMLYDERIAETRIAIRKSTLETAELV
jgi:hypothetical protein